MELRWREEDGARLASSVWRAGPGLRTISSAMLGGGIGAASWVLNAQVAGAYARTDPVAHLRELAASHGLDGPGVGMLTAASVARTARGSDEGVAVSATVGLRVPTWASSPAGAPDPELVPLQVDGPPPPRVHRPGTVNIVVSLPVPLEDAALVNAVMTATEAKTQALLEAGYPCTGTASDAICVAAPAPVPGGTEPDPFAGPRSVWGARIARAVHAAVYAGAVDYTEWIDGTRR
ncbi:adenosylcobinamide amidohydrolase [Spirillospora sp. NBC_01491]|uniref:adenosylcobinamide amidohydrolase n=1 Tax=Spirillospora sp. NBC_01491 TaxID=2976007 RepID=UPI00255B074F|nr:MULTISPECIES: adenosylcobinamide amidohydrolase [Thermomonosporaceae]MDL4774481.1 adenosylcobinamide amidohydrolase [Actinomadura xylanilytica]